MGIEAGLECPSCHKGVLVAHEQNAVKCQNDACGRLYPVKDGVPVLICEERSLFDLSDFTQADGVTTMDVRGISATSIKGKAKELVLKLLPDKSASVCDYRPDDLFADLARERADARILVIGAGDARFSSEHALDITYTDVTLGPLTDVIADAHDLPFKNESFDVVVAVAVLEHVINPYQVAAEVGRVLRLGGTVYANTPFMQQVHLGAYDFTRFSHLGHRFLWRQFDEVRSGVSNGPGMAVSWAVEYFFRTLIKSKRIENFFIYPARLLFWPFRFLDRFISKKPGVYDAASAYYFVGTKRKTPMQDRELIKEYKGKQ